MSGYLFYSLRANEKKKGQLFVRNHANSILKTNALSSTVEYITLLLMLLCMSNRFIDA